jgi:hypothetical protein
MSLLEKLKEEKAAFFWKKTIFSSSPKLLLPQAKNQNQQQLL